MLERLFPLMSREVQSLLTPILPSSLVFSDLGLLFKIETTLKLMFVMKPCQITELDQPSSTGHALTSPYKALTAPQTFVLVWGVLSR